MPAPKGNTNAMTHGGKLAKRVRGGTLPKGLRQVEDVRNKYLRSIEAALLQVGQIIGPREKLIIESIGDAIARKLILQKRHRDNPQLPLDTEMKLLDSITKTNRELVALVKQLKLDPTAETLRKLLYGNEAGR